MVTDQLVSCFASVQPLLVISSLFISGPATFNERCNAQCATHSIYIILLLSLPTYGKHDIVALVCREPWHELRANCKPTIDLNPQPAVEAFDPHFRTSRSLGALHEIPIFRLVISHIQPSFHLFPPIHRPHTCLSLLLIERDFDHGRILLNRSTWETDIPSNVFIHQFFLFFKCLVFFDVYALFLYLLVSFLQQTLFDRRWGSPSLWSCCFGLFFFGAVVWLREFSRAPSGT